jgi:hypothetical protein
LAWFQTFSKLPSGVAVENRKVPDTQFGFYPDRSTIQPMFILKHLVHAAKQTNQRVVPTFTQPLFILNKHMTLLTDHTFGII